MRKRDSCTMHKDTMPLQSPNMEGLKEGPSKVQLQRKFSNTLDLVIFLGEERTDIKGKTYRYDK